MLAFTSQPMRGNPNSKKAKPAIATPNRAGTISGREGEKYLRRPTLVCDLLKETTSPIYNLPCVVVRPLLEQRCCFNSDGLDKTVNVLAVPCRPSVATENVTPAKVAERRSPHPLTRRHG